MAVTKMDAIFEEEAFEDSFCPPLPIAPLSNVTNVLAAKEEAKAKEATKEKKEKPKARQDGKRYYGALKQLAEEYAVLKKQSEQSDHDDEAALWGLVHRARAVLFQQGATVPAKQSTGAATDALHDLVRPFVPEENGTLLSVGSLPHVCGEACATGACRFHRKGKCFDGVLCRFCHCSGEHVKPAKPRAMPKARGRAEPVDVKALQALFAALDMAAPNGQMPAMPALHAWPRPRS